MMIDVDWRQPFIDHIHEQKVPSTRTRPNNSFANPRPMYSSGTSSTGEVPFLEYS
jgi:hypothetical protein